MKGREGRAWRTGAGVCLAVLLLVPVGRAGNVTLEWWHDDGVNRVYDSQGTDHGSDNWRFQVVMDMEGDTDVGLMVSNKYWHIGGEHGDTEMYGADDDETVPAQNANWNGTAGNLDAFSLYEESRYGSKRFYFRFWNDDSTNSATEAGLVFNRLSMGDADPEFLWELRTGSTDFPQAWADLGRENLSGYPGGAITGSVDGVHADGWATMAAGVPQQQQLLIVSAHGGSSPGNGTYTNDHGEAITCLVTNSPRYLGAQATQYLCKGWTGTGSVTNGVGTNATFTLTSDSSLVWRWETNYWVEVGNATDGTTTGGDGWFASGSTTTVEAVADDYYHFTMWTGTVTSASNPLYTTVHRPHDVTPQFSPDLATNGTPHWWMALHRLTNKTWQVEATDDQDEDGMDTWAEWICGTVPTNKMSVLRVQPMQSVSNECLRLEWASVSNREYYVETVTDIAGDGWSITSAVMSGGTGGVLNWVDPGSTGVVSRFYRVQVRMP